MWHGCCPTGISRTKLGAVHRIANYPPRSYEFPEQLKASPWNIASNNPLSRQKNLSAPVTRTVAQAEAEDRTESCEFRRRQDGRYKVQEQASAENASFQNHMPELLAPSQWLHSTTQQEVTGGFDRGRITNTISDQSRSFSLFCTISILCERRRCVSMIYLLQI